ncbi:hypothetical protein FACS1894217_08290 [Clostridia bacterium]|nr:hypothetical protein FACS1894217_08290 [Clostridia bacterium]
MKIVFAIIPAFAVVLMFFLPVTYLKIARNEDAEFATLILAQAADYAGEAAMLASMETDDIFTDYADKAQIRISPRNAADTFAEVLLLNYDVPVTERNVAYVKSKIPVMALCEQDGYFLAEQRESGNSEHELVFAIKRPYTIDTNPEAPNVGKLYNVNLGFTHWTEVNKVTLSVTEHDKIAGFPYSEEQALQWINRDIDLAVNAALKRCAVTFNQSEYQKFYLPLTNGSVDVRRIEIPTLITIIRDLTLGGGAKSDMSSVNGVTVQDPRLVIGWIEGGKKYYAYADDVDVADGELFETIEDAAKAGYYPKF